MKKVTIANMNIECSMIDSNFFNKRMLEYENDTFVHSDMILKTVVCDEIRKPEGDVIKIIGTANIVKTGDNKFCRYITEINTGRIVQTIHYSGDYSDVEINLHKSRNYLDLSLTNFEYLLTGAAFSDKLTILGGAVLHGSAIAFEDYGIVFSGNSGIGKSTHTRLWKECFGDKVTIVNDDKPAIRFCEGVPFIFGTPWSGKTDLHTNIRVPLKAVVFIKQSDFNHLERLNVRDSIFNLSTQILRPYYDEGIGKRTLEVIEKLVINVPIYRLHCNISQKAVDVAYDELIKKGRE